jgi:DNA-binding transcriptional LysR family regulator
MIDVPKALADGRLDIGFVRLPMALPSGISRHILVRDEFCVALPAGHSLAGAASAVRPAALAGEAFVMPEQDEGTYEVGRRGRFAPYIVGAPGSLVAVLAQVSLGAGVSVLPSVLATAVRIPNVVFRSLVGEPITSQVAAIYRTRDPTPAVKNLMQQIKKSTPVRLQLPDRPSE